MEELDRGMLAQTFIHIPGIGRRTEQELWAAGVACWDDFADFFTRPAAISSALRRRLEAFIPPSIEAVRRRDASYFRRLSTLGEAWRLFPEFAEDCVFLDIETTGLSPVFDTVTMVGLFDGCRYDVFINGRNLDELPAQLKKYSVIVTFNGAGFDLRFLKLTFEDLELPPIHIDLRWVTRRLGYRGSLKSIEREFGISRDQSIKHVNGHEATVLWSRYLRGDRRALSQLIAYNTEDVVHLKAIMEMAYDKLAKQLSTALGDRKPIYAGLSSVPAVPKLRRRRKSKRTQTLVAELLERSAMTKPTVVGIDLTGSERRPTGWAVLHGPGAETKSIVSDDDIVRETLLAKPDLVSIDSPLSVPEGWSRAQEQLTMDAPIYRKCELALKRMGISVFWCLLPTMRSLTMRGMRIAEELRKHGIRIIESYPGAAQDILTIPRKGSSLEELKRGLSRAGIEGSFVTRRVTHDEVDAITSALVGLFYLANHYLALGTRAEDYLIVPRSPKISYSRLSAILSATGLDPVDPARTDKSEIDTDAQPKATPAFAN
jgi:uncharacterized protein YprB with RNaseH-like and TPR domain/predicted nuclease with RNAse H fold